MSSVKIACGYCKKSFYRSTKHVNENIKLNQKTYCSNKCVGFNNKKAALILTCENKLCKKKFRRQKYELSRHNYCSSSCAATVNYKNLPKRSAGRKNCATCQKEFISRKKYCSFICKVKDQTIPSEQIIKRIKKFYLLNGRIPLKREFPHEVSARRRFGSWNKAMLASGFKPNNVLFTKKYISKDGHTCDSLAEMIIDDWLFRNGIQHQRGVFYPGNKKLSVDFVVQDYWIEFFGLHGQHKRYDELRNEKIKLAKYYNLKFIELYPSHLFPKNKLNDVLTVLI